jgi:preprotein translocase subunit SecA
VLRYLQSLFAPSRNDGQTIRQINALRSQFARHNDSELRKAAQTKEILAVFAATAVIASRVLNQDMFDVQLRGALALSRGSIAEMQTGEGKTLAAVPAVAWYALQGKPVHVITANDYLARRDASWMGDVYRALGLSVGHLQQTMTANERRGAYACEVMYATANEVGFDFLRDRLALRRPSLVQREFGVAIIDEADSILIDEARTPLVIAGGDADDSTLSFAVDHVVRGFRAPVHCSIDAGARNVALTDYGIASVETAFACGNLYEDRNLRLLTAVQDALHAHILLHRDVDYVVKNGAVEMVDEFKGRIALDRRWPAGLHTAVEVKEGVATKRQGMILGSITLQHLAGLYSQICGMTGTAATQAEEFQKVYGLSVEVIPTNRPVQRRDFPDALFATRAEKEQSILSEIRTLHATGRPVLVGTASVAESERLSRMLSDVPHSVLNARQDENEAAVIARAGERGAVTISTNMAGRGTDIRLGPGVAELGGLHVVGTQRHESRRIDNQLRGRAGRQGDPGSSRFFVSMEDDLIVKWGDLNPGLGRDPETVQRLVEGRYLDARLYLMRYESAIEGQRHRIHSWRQEILEGRSEYESELQRTVALRTIDELWSDYLASIAELRSGLPWVQWGLAGLPGVSLDRRDAYYEYARKIHDWFRELEAELPEEITRRVTNAEANGAVDSGDRGAVWTYVMTEQPFGTFMERLARGLRRRFGA